MQTEGKEFISLTDDLLFKEAFGSFENRKYLEDLLESYYGFKKGYLKDRLEVQYESQLTKSKYNEKSMRGDLVVRFLNIIVSIEMYKKFNKESFLKSKSYVMRIYSTEIKRKEKYGKTKKVTQINFVDKTNIRISDDIKTTYYFGPKELSEDISMDIVQLDKAREVLYNNNDRFTKYLKFIGAKTKEEREEVARGDDILMEMDNWLEYYTNDKETDEFFRTYNRDYWNERIYREDGRQKGIIEGAKERNIEIAKNLLNMNMSIKDISTATSLSIEEIENLKTE